VSSRAWLAAALVAMFALTGCGAGRLLLPGAGPEAELFARVQVSMEASRYWLEDGSVCQGNTGYHQRMLGMLADLVASPQARRLDASTLEAIFNLGVHSGDLPWISVWVDLTAGGRDKMLVSALWCGEGFGHWLYVLDRSGEVWHVAGPRDTGFDGLRARARWLGDAWVISDNGDLMAIPKRHMALVMRDGDGWALVDPFEGRAEAWLNWPGPEPTYRFAGGYRRLLVRYHDGVCVTESAFEWVGDGPSGRYEPLGEVARRPLLCGVW
jgi:hypothetical protein